MDQDETNEKLFIRINAVEKEVAVFAEKIDNLTKAVEAGEDRRKTDSLLVRRTFLGVLASLVVSIFMLALGTLVAMAGLG